MKYLFLCFFLLSFSGFLMAQTNLLTNGDVEDLAPAFWEKMNGDSELSRATDTAATGSYSLKIEKSAASSNAIGWKTVNNANLYWNHAGSEGADLFNLNFSAKTMGVNTNPANEDATIGVKFTFIADGSVLGEQLVAVDQSTTDSDFKEYSGAISISATPDEVYAEAIMGKDATGTVWFDNINCNTNAGWTMGVFNGSIETAEGWMNWTSGDKIGFANVVEGGYASDHSVMLSEQDENDDEMVFYSTPVPAEAGKWYRISVMAKTEGVNTGEGWFGSNVTPDHDANRLGVNFFFHKAPIETNWDLVGGDQFMYFDQRVGKDSVDWHEYSVIAKAPEEAAGVSMRARFNNTCTGNVYYDNFSIEEIEPMDNLLTNGDVEDLAPAFWEKMNGDSELSRATDTAATGSYSLKIEKSAASSNAIGWKTVNNANLYWNHAGSEGADLFNLNFSAKTMGVNTNPANEDATIGVKFTFIADGSVLGEQLVAVDQSTTDSDFKEYSGAISISATPDEVYAEAIMGKDATGTVWFDNINCNTNAGWTMGVFNGSIETAEGWMNWTSGDKIGFANVVEGGYASDHSVMLSEQDENDDEMVFYSTPVPAEAGKWYRISVMAKTEGVNTGEGWFGSNVTPDHDANRLGVNFFFHKAPIETNWDLVGGDQFMYFDQRVGKDSVDWYEYNVIAKAPEEAAGVSMRARFNNTCTGNVYYDNFTINEVKLIISSLEKPSSSITLTPSDFELKNNYPNPFNPETIIEYVVPKNGEVKLVVYDMIGRKVRTLVNRIQPAGTYQVYWNGKNDQGDNLSSGVYFYQLRGQNSLITKKMTLVK